MMKKAFRVKKSSEIEEIIRQKKSVGSKHFVLYTKKNHGQNHFRFAVSVSKKFGNAVERNVAKRRVREIISKLDIQDTYDVFVVIKKHANGIPFSTYEEEITSLVTKQKIMR
jgi:ribonuclease P protein component